MPKIRGARARENMNLDEHKSPDCWQAHASGTGGKGAQTRAPAHATATKHVRRASSPRGAQRALSYAAVYHRARFAVSFAARVVRTRMCACSCAPRALAARRNRACASARGVRAEPVFRAPAHARHGTHLNQIRSAAPKLTTRSFVRCFNRADVSCAARSHAPPNEIKALTQCARNRPSAGVRARCTELKQKA